MASDSLKAHEKIHVSKFPSLVGTAGTLHLLTPRRHRNARSFIRRISRVMIAWTYHQQIRCVEKPVPSGKVIQETLQQGFWTSDQVPTFKRNKLFDLKLQRLGTNSHRMHVKFTDSNISQIHKKYQLTGGSGSFPIWNILSLNVSIFLAKMFTPHLCASDGIPAPFPVCAASWRMIFDTKKLGKNLKKPSFGFCRCSFFTFQIKKSTSIPLMKFPLDKTAGVFKQASASPNWCHSDFSRNSGVSKKAADFLCWKNSVGIRCFGSSCVGTFSHKKLGKLKRFFPMFFIVWKQKKPSEWNTEWNFRVFGIFFPTL